MLIREKNLREQKNKTKAIEIYDKVLELAENAGDSAILYNNKSIVYKDFSDFAYFPLDITSNRLVGLFSRGRYSGQG